MSSDYSAYGAIADGDYQITFSQKKYDYWNNNPQKRKIPKYYQVNNCQPIDCIDYNHSWLRNEGYSFWGRKMASIFIAQIEMELQKGACLQVVF